MDVRFTRTGERRYAVGIEIPDAPALVMHPAPGYDPLIPHDLVHLAVELECGIAHGVFGQVAAGGTAGTRSPSGRRSHGTAVRARRRTRTSSACAHGSTRSANPGDHSASASR